MSIPDLTIFVPSKGRPNSVKALWVEFERTCTAKTQVVFVLDDMNDAPMSIKSRMDFKMMIAPSGRRGMCDALNFAFDQYRAHESLGFAVGFMGDDHRPRTHGWDETYLSALDELGTGFVYGDDLFQGEKIPTQVAMTTDIPLKLGWMTPPEFQHLYVDNYWKALGEGIGRLKYLPYVVVEHMHYLNGKAEKDGNYEAVNNVSVASLDAHAWKQYLRSGKMQKDIDSVRELL